MNQESGPTTIDLEAGSEWRFELEDDENIAVRVSPLSCRNPQKVVWKLLV
jgi:hypothetical protein